MAEPKGKNAIRVPASTVLRSPVHMLAFWFGSGLSPKAPGTAGTLGAIPLWFLLRGLSWPAYILLVAALFAFGCWVCGESSRKLGVHDYGGIVFDEVVGLLITCIPLVLPHDWPSYWCARPFDSLRDFLACPQAFGLLAAFLLFRLFDIWKPWPIGWFDRRVHGGLGIMLDDVLAAIYAAAILAALLMMYVEHPMRGKVF